MTEESFNVSVIFIYLALEKVEQLISSSACYNIQR